MKKVLAIDMGATSIRGMIGYVENNQLVIKEVMRMSHKIIKKGDYFQWQWEEIIDKIIETIVKYSDEITSVGIDAWGVDFGIMDEKGELIQNPISYREPKHRQGYEEAVSIVDEEEIFLNTGNQVMNINTLFQLLAMKKNNPETWNKIHKILMLPDLIQYMLTGNMVGEETILSTSQMMDLNEKDYSMYILDRLGIQREWLPTIIKAGEKTGNTRTSKIKRLREYSIDVISVCGHDTASAMLVTEAFYRENCMFLSCGTWSLIGAAISNAILNHEVYNQNLTNELGYDSKVMFFKNINGLYLLERLKNEFEILWGKQISFEEITKYVENTAEITGLVDVEHELFSKEESGMKEAINQYLNITNQTIPQHDMDYFKIIYESLANKYLEVKNAIEALLEKSFESIHMVGGGARSEYFCQLISDKLDMPVISGPFEATALGNILVQLKTIGEIEDMETGIHLVKQSQSVKYYRPNTNVR